MKFSRNKKNELQKAAKKSGLEFIRLFGSAVHSKKKARDIDVVLGNRKLNLAQLSALTDTLEHIFGKPVDVVQLRPDLSPALIREIAQHSIPLWEAPKTGRLAYAESLDRFLAIAEDEILAFPQKMKDQAFKQVQRRLRVP